MLMLLRTIIVIPYLILFCLMGAFYAALVRPRDPRHTYTFGRRFSLLAPIFGIRVHVRHDQTANMPKSCVYIANHQNNYDLVTGALALQPGTVTVGKKSLIWIPFFGLLYWLTGNILIDRSNRNKSHNTIAQIVEQIKKRHLSIWMFPEGTRSRGRGLLPFKTGAFHAAIAAGVPIVPVCVSETTGQIKLNRWNNGTVLVEVLAPIETTQYHKGNVRELMDHCHHIMAEKIAQLTREAAEMDQKKASTK